MEQRIANGLLWYLCLVVLITFHEFGHAWMAWKRGDDTARLMGRISLNPVVHMDLLGTIILPLAAIFMGAMGSGAGMMLFGWGKPVPVNTALLRNRGLDWMLIAVAGPAMNLIAALLAVSAMRAGAGFPDFVSTAQQVAELSLYLCFFNLLPIPPLDGSHVARYFFNISEAAYMRLAQYGFFFVFIAIQLRPVQMALGLLTNGTLVVMAQIFGVR